METTKEDLEDAIASLDRAEEEVLQAIKWRDSRREVVEDLKNQLENF